MIQTGAQSLRIARWSVLPVRVENRWPRDPAAEYRGERIIARDHGFEDVGVANSLHAIVVRLPAPSGSSASPASRPSGPRSERPGASSGLEEPDRLEHPDRLRATLPVRTCPPGQPLIRPNWAGPRKCFSMTLLSPSLKLAPPKPHLQDGEIPRLFASLGGVSLAQSCIRKGSLRARDRLASISCRGPHEGLPERALLALCRIGGTQRQTRSSDEQT